MKVEYIRKLDTCDCRANPYLVLVPCTAVASSACRAASAACRGSWDCQRQLLDAARSGWPTPMSAERRRRRQPCPRLRRALATSTRADTGTADDSAAGTARLAAVPRVELELEGVLDVELAAPRRRRALGSPLAQLMSASPGRCCCCCCGGGGGAAARWRGGGTADAEHRQRRWPRGGSWRSAVHRAQEGLGVCLGPASGRRRGGRDDAAQPLPAVALTDAQRAKSSAW